MPKMTKVLRRQISADERIEKYFHQERRKYSMEMMRRYRLASVEQETRSGTTLVLQIRSVIETADGIIIKVR